MVFSVFLDDGFGIMTPVPRAEQSDPWSRHFVSSLQARSRSVSRGNTELITANALRLRDRKTLSLRSARGRSPYLKLSVTNSDLHFIACLRDARYNTAVVFSRHDCIAAPQDGIGIQGREPALHPFDVGGLQLNMME